VNLRASQKGRNWRSWRALEFLRGGVLEAARLLILLAHAVGISDGCPARIHLIERLYENQGRVIWALLGISARHLAFAPRYTSAHN
jgi:hypothetical protein